MTRANRKLSVEDSVDVISLWQHITAASNRLTSGEFDTPDFFLSKIGAQQIFLYRVRILARQVLRDLNREPFKIYKAANLPAYDPRVVGGVWEDIQSDNIPKSEPALGQLRKSIWDWSSRWHLDAEWCRARAFFTLVNWGLTPEELTRRGLNPNNDRLKSLQWSYERHPIWVAATNQKVFEFKWSWHPLRSSRRTVDKLARAIFNKEWREYLNTTAEQFRQDNDCCESKQVPKQEHFDWLVDYQILRMEYEAILLKENMVGTVQAIRKAVKETANLIGLSLRPPDRTRGQRRNNRY